MGDNLDKNVRPSFERQELKAQSMHYFHGCALRDRINLHDLSDVTPRSLPEPSQILPAPSDLSSLNDELIVIISRLVLSFSITQCQTFFCDRILVQHVDEFKPQRETVPLHIPSKHSKEMAAKSEVVSAVHEHRVMLMIGQQND